LKLRITKWGSPRLVPLLGSLIANLLLLYYDEEIYNLIDHMIEKVEGIF
jgi:hypothetical protein